MNSTNFVDYLAHLSDSDLDLPIRVVFRANLPVEIQDLVQKQLQLKIFYHLPLSGLFIAGGPAKLILQLVRHPSVQAAWEDQKLFLCSQSVLDAIGISSITQSWLKPSGKGVRVALLDSGIDSTHPDLHDVVIARKSFILEEPASNQLNPHGTSLAGIIGGTRGIASSVEFIDAQVFHLDGVAFLSEVVETLTWVATQAPALILFGGVMLPGSMDDNPLAILCQQVLATGIPIIAPAGNFGPEQATIGCPASIPGIIAVGAVTLEGDPAFFSSRGASTGSPLKPEIVLPGVGIRTLGKIGEENTPELINGTSAAAAICTGLLALILSGRKNIKPPALTDAIIHAAEDINQNPISQGHGILNGITLARHFNLLYMPPDPFKKVVLSSILIASLVTVIVIVAMIVTYLLR